jgi:hypothetical protein
VNGKGMPGAYEPLCRDSAFLPMSVFRRRPENSLKNSLPLHSLSGGGHETALSKTKWQVLIEKETKRKGANLSFGS